MSSTESRETPGPLRRALRSPAVHCLLLGALWFAAERGWVDQSATSGARETVVVSASRIERAKEDFAAQKLRPPTEDEVRDLVRVEADRELLFRHALDLGLARQPAAQHRLALIASFVEPVGADSGESLRPEDVPILADRALQLGLHRDDLVVRKLMIDSAERLIRGAVLARRPTDEELEEHLDTWADRYRAPPSVTLRVVGLPRGTSENRAAVVLACLATEGCSADRTVETFPPLLPTDLARRFGQAFSSALDVETEAWQGPLLSRRGPQLVQVVDYEPAHVPALEEVRERVEADARQALADQWLSERLDQLRAEVEIVVGPSDAGAPAETMASQPISAPVDAGSDPS